MTNTLENIAILQVITNKHQTQTNIITNTIHKETCKYNKPYWCASNIKSASHAVHKLLPFQFFHVISFSFLFSYSPSNVVKVFWRCWNHLPRPTHSHLPQNIPSLTDQQQSYLSLSLCARNNPVIMLHNHSWQVELLWSHYNQVIHHQTYLWQLEMVQDLDSTEEREKVKRYVLHCNAAVLPIYW